MSHQRPTIVQCVRVDEPLRPGPLTDRILAICTVDACGKCAAPVRVSPSSRAAMKALTSYRILCRQCSEYDTRNDERVMKLFMPE